MAYNPNMLRGATIPLPWINPKKHSAVVSLRDDPNRTVLDYDHHSVVVSKARRLAIYSACNIDGSSIPEEEVDRRGSFRDDDRIEAEEQVGDLFYDKCGHLIDKGHLTKYEDVIWGRGLSDEEYLALGKSTNFYPNAVPQHRSLNRGMWSNLELYVLDNEVDENDLKICMFTGPVLGRRDPWYFEVIGEDKIRVPLHFWKIVVYKKKGELFALGFMMSHKTLLDETGMFVSTMPKMMEILTESTYFMDYKHSIPYQVKVELIEQLAGIKLSANLPINMPYQDERPSETIFDEIDVRVKTMLESERPERKIRSSYTFSNLVTD